MQAYLYISHKMIARTAKAVEIYYFLLLVYTIHAFKKSLYFLCNNPKHQNCICNAFPPTHSSEFCVWNEIFTCDSDNILE